MRGYGQACTRALAGETCRAAVGLVLAFGIVVVPQLFSAESVAPSSRKIDSNPLYLFRALYAYVRGPSGHENYHRLLMHILLFTPFLLTQGLV